MAKERSIVIATFQTRFNTEKGRLAEAENKLRNAIKKIVEEK
jgi:hypothetical protein